MAINYTTLLGLAQPVTGTEANTWGTVVNDEITALLDSAIAGAATLDVTAGNVTLTATAGVGNQARMAILLVTGTPGTTRNIVAPSQSKTYIVVNQSNASVVLKGSATTGVTIRAGQAATCVWNGADFESVASGDVDGPSSATDTAIAIFDGTTGKLIKNTGVTIDGSNNVSGVVQLNATTLDATNLEVTNLKAKDGTAAGSIADSTGVVTLASSVLTTTDINGGTVDNTAIGATTASTVRATQVDITAQGDLRLQDTTGGEFVALQAPGTLATSYTLTLPVDDGTSGQALITDGSGVLSWSTAASGDVYGPASATDNAIARYDGTTGKIIQNSAVTIADDGATVIAANSTSDGLRITQIGTGNALVVEDSANPDATPFVIDASGNVTIGNAIPAAGFGQLQVVGSTAFASALIQLDSNGSPSILSFLKTRGTVPSIQTVVQSGDQIGTLRFYGSDGTTYIRGAAITAEVDGTPGTNDMPGRLIFLTTADGASSPTERMRIDNQGRVGIGGTPNVDVNILFAKSITGATSHFGVASTGTVQSDVTSQASMFFANPKTQAASFTTTNLFYYNASQGSFGAGSTVTNQFGFRVDTNVTGATNNYGFFSNIASGTGRWNFYANGTADNFFAGKVGIGVVSDGANLKVTGSTSTTAFQVAGNGNANLYIDFSGSGDNYYDASNHRFRSASGTTERMRIASTGTISLGAAPGAESLRVTPVASAVNYLNVSGATTSNGPTITTEGSDTNINVFFSTKGTGLHVFRTNNGAQNQFVIAHTASAVNYLQVTGAATGSGATLSTAGSDTNVAMTLATKGTGGYFFFTDTVQQFRISHTASAVNYLRVTGAATGVSPVLSAQGSDTNIDLALTPKGTGVLRFGTYTAGILAQAGYITIKDAAGNTRNLLVG
jgi:hypothetical protein